MRKPKPRTLTPDPRCPFTKWLTDRHKPLNTVEDFVNDIEANILKIKDDPHAHENKTDRSR